MSRIHPTAFALLLALSFVFATLPVLAEAATVTPKISSFTASPSILKLGAAAVISWKATDADGCQLRYDYTKNGMSGSQYVYSSLGGSDSYTVLPLTTTTYEVYCTKGTTIAGGISSASKK